MNMWCGKWGGVIYSALKYLVQNKYGVSRILR